MPIIVNPTFATGDTIEAAPSNNLRDNDQKLDARTGGDPGALGKLLRSSSSLNGEWFGPGTDAHVLMMVSGVPTWAQITSAGITDGTIINGDLAAGVAVANLGYAPVSRTGGDTMASKLTVSGNSGAGNNLNALDLTNAAGSNAGTYLRFITAQGAMTFGFFYGNNVFNLLDQNGTEALSIHWGDTLLYRYGNKVWDAGNDGSGSGLDADTVDGKDTGTGAGNIAFYDGSGRVAAASLADTATTATAAGSATVATLANGIADGAVSTTAKLANLIVTAAKIANATITDTQVAAANKDGTISTPSLRTLGTGSTQAAAGDHTHSQMAKIGTGSYSGNSTTHAITGVGFAPQVVFITTSAGALGMIQNGLSAIWVGGNAVAASTASLTSDGFSFTGAGGGLNSSGTTYSYVALG